MDSDKCQLCGGEIVTSNDAEDRCCANHERIFCPCGKWMDRKVFDLIQSALALQKRVQSGKSVEFPITLMAKLVYETENNPYGHVADGVRMAWVECELLAKNPAGPLFDSAQNARNERKGEE